jgi:tRNA-dihydrouridine synthase B
LPEGDAFTAMGMMPHRLFLAPMAELSTPALRHVVKDMCSEVVLFSEMLSAGAIAAGADHNEPLVKKHDFDDPLIYQIVGSDPGVMSAATAILSEKKCLSVDINMGCPNHDIVKKGQGARLLTDPAKAKKIIRECRKAALSLLSVKMRTGYETNDEKQFTEFLTMLEGEGVDFITVHPRYARLSLKRKADWRLVALAKKTVSIPVIGNGDIDHPSKVIEKMNETGCDGIMIGREAVKSPWIFSLANDLLNGRKASMEVNLREIFIKTLEYIETHLPERLHKSRGHRFSYYFTGNATFGHELFTQIRKEACIQRIKEIVDDYYQRNIHEAIRHIDLIPLLPHREGEGAYQADEII